MIVILCHNIRPYHLTRFNSLLKKTADFRIIEIFIKDNIYLWDRKLYGFEKHVISLFDNGLFTDKRINEKLISELEKLKPEILITVGYSESFMRSAVIWAKKVKVTSVMMTDTWGEYRKRNYIIEKIKGYWLRQYYAALFLSGQLSLEYFSKLGFPKSMIWLGVDVVDNEYFYNSKKKYQNAGQINPPYFLCCARLSPEKNIHRLIEAFRKYRQKGGSWNLIITGDGPIKDGLISNAINLPNVIFTGWIQYKEIGKYYSNASCFILPSTRETWGLVVNEAMASGLPVLISRQCGCLPELCKRGVNGWDFDPYSVDNMCDLMLRVSSLDIDKLNDMGKLSLSIIENYSPATWTGSFLDCIYTLIKRNK